MSWKQAIFNARATLMRAAKAVWRLVMRLAYHIPRIAPVVLMGGLSLYGISLFLLSHPFDVASVCLEIDTTLPCKQVGYVYAPNWVLNPTVVMPLAAFFLLSAIKSIPRAIDSLARHHMLVDANLAPLDSQLIVSEWNEVVSKATPFLAALLLVAAVQPIIEWTGSSAHALLTGSRSDVAEEEYDWSVAGIISQPKWSMAGRIMNASFSLLVFASQFAMIALVATLLVFVASFCHFLHQRTQWNIVPNPKDGDQRRGFQIFEEPISHLLVAAFLVLAMLYLSIIQNHYLRTSHEHIDVFVKDDILLGATRGLDENPKEFIQRLIDTRPSKLRPNVKNFSRAADLLGGFLIVSFVFGLPLWILRGVAQSGKALLERQGGHRPFNMVFWPLGYVSVSLYLILCILAVLSLLYYRIGLFVFGLLILVAVARIMRIAQQSISAGSNP